DAGEVALLDPRDRWDLAVRARQVLEHLALHDADRLAPLAGRRLAGTAAAHVQLGDPSLRPGALNLVQVHAELGRNAPNEGGSPNVRRARPDMRGTRSSTCLLPTGVLRRRRDFGRRTDDDEHRSDGDD